MFVYKKETKTGPLWTSSAVRWHFVNFKVHPFIFNQTWQLDDLWRRWNLKYSYYTLAAQIRTNTHSTSSLSMCWFREDGNWKGPLFSFLGKGHRAKAWAVWFCMVRLEMRGDRHRKEPHNERHRAFHWTFWHLDFYERLQISEKAKNPACLANLTNVLSLKNLNVNLKCLLWWLLLPSWPEACHMWDVLVYGLVWLGETPCTSTQRQTTCSSSCRPRL